MTSPRLFMSWDYTTVIHDVPIGVVVIRRAVGVNRSRHQSASIRVLSRDIYLNEQMMSHANTSSILTHVAALLRRDRPDTDRTDQPSINMLDTFLHMLPLEKPRAVSKSGNCMKHSLPLTQ